MEELKESKLYRLIARITFAFIGFILPIIVMIVKYKFIKKVELNTLTMVGIFVFLFSISLLWKFKKQLYDWINSWEYSAFKYVLIGFSKIYIFILITIMFFLAKHTVTVSLTQGSGALTELLDAISFCVILICSCQILAYIVVYPIEQKYDYKVKRLLRKKERVEDYKDAQNN